MPESKYRIESYEPTPGQKRTQNMSELLQAIGGFTDRNNIPFLSSHISYDVNGYHTMMFMDMCRNQTMKSDSS